MCVCAVSVTGKEFAADPASPGESVGGRAAEERWGSGGSRYFSGSCTDVEDGGGLRITLHHLAINK